MWSILLDRILWRSGSSNPEILAESQVHLYMRCRLCGWTFLLILGVVPIGCTVDENERPQSIIFDSGPDGGEAIYAVDPKGGEIRRLTPSSMLNRYSRVPDWSPDRTMIAFQSNIEDEEHSDIYVMEIVGIHHVDLSAPAAI